MRIQTDSEYENSDCEIQEFVLIVSKLALRSRILGREV